MDGLANKQKTQIKKPALDKSYQFTQEPLLANTSPKRFQAQEFVIATWIHLQPPPCKSQCTIPFKTVERSFKLEETLKRVLKKDRQ